MPACDGSTLPTTGWMNNLPTVFATAVACTVHLMQQMVNWLMLLLLLLLMLNLCLLSGQVLVGAQAAFGATAFQECLAHRRAGRVLDMEVWACIVGAHSLKEEGTHWHSVRAHLVLQRTLRPFCARPLQPLRAHRHK